MSFLDSVRKFMGLDDESVNSRSNASSGASGNEKATYCGECEYYNNNAFGAGNAVCGESCGHVVRGSTTLNCELTGYPVSDGQRCTALSDLNRVCQNKVWGYAKVVSSGDYACRYPGKRG